MSKALRDLCLTLAAVLSLGPPALGAFLRWGGWPPGFGVFPPEIPRDAHGVPIPEPGFSPLYFAVGALVALTIVALLVRPAWFGFAPALATAPSQRRGAPPWWMWAGLVLNVCCWSMMWFSPSPLVKYLFTPLWWGFIAVVDGVVYARTGGASIFAKLPRQLLWLVLMSIVGWFFFEWLNYFVLENWVYPNSPAIFSEAEAYFWFALTYTCVWPAIFEWYTLLRTFPSLTRRWASGPRVCFGRGAMWIGLGIGTGMGVLAGLFPYPLFFTVWLGSLLMLPAAMALLGYWTPFAPLAKGNWTPAILMALAGLANGVFWEFWNHGSNAFLPGRNPNFWVYDIPYVNVIHLFSEMPLLGYFGYLPFGLQCWMWWLLAAHLLNLDPDFDPERVGLPGGTPALAPLPTPAVASARRSG
ncbi:MAG: small-conductance mechanosensitive channel [Polyangiales bacterium]